MLRVLKTSFKIAAILFFVPVGFCLLIAVPIAIGGTPLFLAVTYVVAFYLGFTALTVMFVGIVIVVGMWLVALIQKMPELPPRR